MSLIKLSYFSNREGNAERGAISGAVTGAAGVPLGMYAVKKVLKHQHDIDVKMKDIHKLIDITLKEKKFPKILNGKRAMIAGASGLVLTGAGSGALAGILIRKNKKGSDK